MTMRGKIMKIAQQDELNFLLTNYIPRRLTTSFMGWFSRIENPIVCRLSLLAWRTFSDLDLGEASETAFKSMHACFTRRLKDGARPIRAEADALASPCDGIVGSFGTVIDGQVLQVKNSPYALDDLLGDAAHAAYFANGRYVTLRLTSAMYHRFHAPFGCRVTSVTHVFGDVWNVNPATLKRVRRLFCRNERAVIRATLTNAAYSIALVPVAAIWVAGIRLGFLDMPLRDGARGRKTIMTHAALDKGEEMGWFEHGSTIIVFAPHGFEICQNVVEGMTIRAGEPLMSLPVHAG